MELQIDISDWEAEARELEADMSTKAEAIKSRIEHQMHPAQAGRVYIVARELGMADPEMLPASKIMLMVGAAKEWSAMEAREYEEVQLKNGKKVKVRALICPVPEDEPPEDDGDEVSQFNMELEGELAAGPEPTDDNPSPVAWNDPLATDRAINYIMNRVAGYLYGRLKIIAANEGDVFSVWNEFCDEMQQKVVGLV